MEFFRWFDSNPCPFVILVFVVCAGVSMIISAIRGD